MELIILAIIAIICATIVLVKFGKIIFEFAFDAFISFILATEVGDWAIKSLGVNDEILVVLLIFFFIVIRLVKYLISNRKRK